MPVALEMPPPAQKTKGSACTFFLRGVGGFYDLFSTFFNLRGI
jgi:hypothetical protein